MAGASSPAIGSPSSPSARSLSSLTAMGGVGGVEGAGGVGGIGEVDPNAMDEEEIAQVTEELKRYLDRYQITVETPRLFRERRERSRDANERALNEAQSVAHRILVQMRNMRMMYEDCLAAAESLGSDNPDMSLVDMLLAHQFNNDGVD